MGKLSRKFIAMLLIVWLPLFSGVALADSLGMQITKRDCNVADSKSGLPTLAHSGMSHQHHQAADTSTDSMPHDQSDSSCNACGVCHFACSGFLAGVINKLHIGVSDSRIFANAATGFRSFKAPPLVPPPLTVA